MVVENLLNKIYEMQHNKSTIKKKDNNKYIDHNRVALEEKNSNLLCLK